MKRAYSQRRSCNVNFFIFLFFIIICDWFFFFNDTATTEIYTLSLHDALPIYIELDEYLFNIDANDLKPGVQKKIHKQLEKEMLEIFYGRNISK